MGIALTADSEAPLDGALIKVNDFKVGCQLNLRLCYPAATKFVSAFFRWQRITKTGRTNYSN